MSGLKDLYRETVRRHAADPVGYGRTIEVTHRHEGHNPQCGDRVDVQLAVQDGRVETAAFEGEACAICMASASLLCENAPGLSVESLRGMLSELESALRDRQGPDDIGVLSPLLGVRPYPSRVQCALLPWETAVRAVDL